MHISANTQIEIAMIHLDVGFYLKIIWTDFYEFSTEISNIRKIRRSYSKFYVLLQLILQQLFLSVFTKKKRSPLKFHETTLEESRCILEKHRVESYVLQYSFYSPIAFFSVLCLFCFVFCKFEISFIFKFHFYSASSSNTHTHKQFHQNKSNCFLF